MEINAQRLWNRLHQLGQIGVDPQGGVTRWTFTDADTQAKNWLISEMKAAGLDVHEDPVGNVIGVYNPGGSPLAPVLCGSHFDTVRNAGIFDGCLGLLAGVEAAQTFKENQIDLKRPLWIIGYRDEEGNRFNSGMIGSKTVTGKALPEDFLVQDAAGITLKEAMERCGYHPEAYRQGQIDPIYASVELHIEQGKVLEQNQCPVGIVEGIPYLRFYEVTLSGCSGHAGATPMNDRQDPVLAMTEWIRQITESARQKPYTVATVGCIQTFPGSTNVICDHVTFTLDIRSLDVAQIEACLREIEILEARLKSEGIQVRRELRHILYGMDCDERLKHQLETIVEKRNLPVFRLMSGAGHDSQNFKDVCPCAMIFVRSVNGYSHRKEEYTPIEDCAAGANVLMDMLYQLANEEDRASSSPQTIL